MGVVGTVGCPGVLLTVATLLAACSGKTAQTDASVVATVDGQELTTADLGDSLQSPGATANVPQPSRAAIDALINEHLMAEQARDAGLDSDPTVAHALQNARRRILAEAFAARLVPPRSTPTAGETEAYYQQNPALFSQRRLYDLAIFTVDSAALNDKLLATIGHDSSVNALSQLLTQHAIRFEVQHLERAADELPLSQLSQYSATSVGDVLVEAGDYGSSRLVQITAIESRPISLENARPAIQRYLAQRDKAAALDAYLAGARARANITYSTEETAPTRMKQAPAAPARQPTIATGLRTHKALLTALK